MHAWRIVLLPVLLACAIGLGTSHIGHAGLLSLHLATAHHETPPPPPADPRPAIHTHAVVHVAPSDEPHEHSGRGTGSHEHPPHHAKTHEHPRAKDHQHAADRHEPAPPAERPLANAPHEHGGLIHTHDPRSGEELVLPAAPFSEFYLPASAASPPRIVRSWSRTPWIVAAPDQAVPSIESPPPQLPG